MKTDNKFIAAQCDQAGEVCELVAPQLAAKTVYQAAHELIAHIGYHGEIDSRHPLTQALLYALNDADHANKDN